PTLMTWFGFIGGLFYFLNKLLFLFIICLKILFHVGQLFLAFIVDYLCGFTEFIPNFITIFLCNWANIFFPHFMEHLQFAESFVYIGFLGKLFGAGNQFQFAVQIMLKIKIAELPV